MHPVTQIYRRFVSSPPVHLKVLTMDQELALPLVRHDPPLQRCTNHITTP